MEKFSMVSVHFHPGEDSNDDGEPIDQEIRKEEVRLLMEVLEKKFEISANDDRNMLTNDAKFTAYYNRYWKVNQMSDHLPIWIEIETDSSNDFLASKASKM